VCPGWVFESVRDPRNPHRNPRGFRNGGFDPAATERILRERGFRCGLRRFRCGFRHGTFRWFRTRLSVPVWVWISGYVGFRGCPNPHRCSWPDAQAETVSRRLPASTIGKMNPDHGRVPVTANLEETSLGGTRDTRGHLARTKARCRLSAGGERGRPLPMPRHWSDHLAARDGQFQGLRPGPGVRTPPISSPMPHTP
jgi:hypothetical protein